MNPIAKFSLSIQPNEIDVPISYIVTPGYQQIKDTNLIRYEWNYDPRRVFTVQVSLKKDLPGQSNLVISNIFANDIPLHDIDIFGVYRTERGTKVKSYGYMAETGTYTFKIRYAPMMHNYVTWMLAQSLTVS